MLVGLVAELVDNSVLELKIYVLVGLVAELVDALDSKSGEHLLVRVQVTPGPPST